MRQYLKETFPLNASGCDKASEFFTKVISDEISCSRNDAIRLQLSLEDAILHWIQTVTEKDATFTISTVKKGIRIKKLDVSVTLNVNEEKENNPLVFDDKLGDIVSVVPSIAGIWNYRYNNGTNTINVELKRQKNNYTYFAIILGIIAIFGLKQAPKDVQEFTINSVVAPLFDTYLAILRGCVAPMIFLSLLNGILSLGTPERFGRLGKKIFSMFAIVLAGTLLVCCIPVVIQLGAFDQTGSSNFGSGKIINIFLDILPKDIISPFQSGNSLQLVVLGVVLGGVLLPLRRSLGNFQKLLTELYICFNELIGFVSKFMPLFVLTSVIRLGFIDNIFAIHTLVFWIYFSIIFVCVIGFLFPIITIIKLKLPLKNTAKHIFSLWLLAFLTGSTSACMPKIREMCDKKFKLKNSIIDFGAPMGMVLFKPGSAVTLLCMTVGCLSVGGGTISPLMLIFLFIMTFLLSLSIPPIPGGVLACYAVLFDFFGIPASLLAVVSSLDTFIDCAATGCNATMLASTLAISENHNEK